MDAQLAYLDEATRALAAATAVEDVKDVRDKAAALARYYRQRGQSVEAHASAVTLTRRAERRLGALLAETVRPGGDTRLPLSQRATLPADITRSQSSRWQRIASVPDPAFEAYLAAGRENPDRLTSAGLLRLAKRAAHAERRRMAPIREAGIVTDLAALAASGVRFGTIYADPPWRYGNQGTRAATDDHYPTLSVAEIAALPVAAVAAPNAHLHLWTTNAFLPDAFGILVAWGFAYKSVFVWVKPQMGIGNYWRVSHEFLVLGVRGDAPFGDHSIPSWLEARRGRHSAKPEQVRALIERVSPGPYLECFGRRAVAGWTVWGNEVESDLAAGAVRVA